MVATWSEALSLWRTCLTQAQVARAFQSWAGIAWMSSSFWERRHPRYLNTSTHSRTSLLTLNCCRRANTDVTAASLCCFCSTPTWHSFENLWRGQRGLTWIPHHLHLLYLPFLGTATNKSTRCTSLNSCRIIQPSCSRPSDPGKGFGRSLLCNSALAVYVAGGWSSSRSSATTVCRCHEHLPGAGRGSTLSSLSHIGNTAHCRSSIQQLWLSPLASGSMIWLEIASRSNSACIS